MAASGKTHERLARRMRERAGELTALHRRLIQTPTVNHGDGTSAREEEAARVGHEFLRDAGLQSRIVAGAPGRGNLMASIGGGERGKAAGTLLLMSHSDVVPVGDENAWRYPPFSGETAEGRIWGRGSNDCKMLAAAEMFALASLARLGVAWRGEVRLVMAADEEAGGKWGFGWLAENEADFLRADLAINEGGGAYLGRSESGERLFTIGCGEKGRYEIVFRAAGPGAHASVPWGKVNPIATLGACAGRIAQWEGDPQWTSPILEPLAQALGLGAIGTRAALEEILESAASRSAAFGNSLRAQSRMTLVPTMIAGGEKSNAVAAGAELRCDGRILPGQNPEGLERVAREMAAGLAGVTVSIEETAAPSGSEFTEQSRRLFESAITRALIQGEDAGDRGNADPAKETVRVLPSWCTGFTDSRFVRGLGTPTFGFQLVEPSADPDRLSIHCVDESIDAGMLLPCSLALAHLALDFSLGECAGREEEPSESVAASD